MSEHEPTPRDPQVDQREIFETPFGDPALERVLAKVRGYNAIGISTDDVLPIAAELYEEWIEFEDQKFTVSGNILVGYAQGQDQEDAVIYKDMYKDDLPATSQGFEIIKYTNQTPDGLEVVNKIVYAFAVPAETVDENASRGTVRMIHCDVDSVVVETRSVSLEYAEKVLNEANPEVLRLIKERIKLAKKAHASPILFLKDMKFNELLPTMDDLYRDCIAVYLNERLSLDSDADQGCRIEGFVRYYDDGYDEDIDEGDEEALSVMYIENKKRVVNVSYLYFGQPVDPHNDEWTLMIRGSMSSRNQSKPAVTADIPVQSIVSFKSLRSEFFGK